MLVAIDLGTTNSLIALWDGEARLIPNVHGEFLTPSVVGLDDKGTYIVGAAARERLNTHPQLTHALFKRHMGSRKLFQLGRHQLRAEELSSFILKSLKADAELYLGKPVTQAMISVPAYFNDLQRKATLIAGRMAGLDVVRLINEPTAAALAHGLHQDESTFIVLDLGGGTLDVSILELFDGVMQIRASAGDNFLGGEDFVDILMLYFQQLHSLQKLSAAHQARLRHACEILKRQLTTSITAEILVELDTSFKLNITRSEFEKISEPLIQRIALPLERAVKDARISNQDLDAMVLVGGASRMPVIRQLAARLTGLMPLMSRDPDEIICRGVAVQVGLYQKDQALDDIVMTDVAPYSLGISVHNETADQRDYQPLFSPIIERNTPVPVSRSDLFYSVHDQQQKISFDIYQGEQRYAKENLYLGTMSFNIPAKAAGEIKIEVRFTYDVNGLLQVEAQIPGSDHIETLLIEGNPGLLSEADIQQRLSLLESFKIHPREHLPNTYLLMRAARLYETSLGYTREDLNEKIAAFEFILNRQNVQEIEQARIAFQEYLKTLERQL